MLKVYLKNKEKLELKPINIECTHRFIEITTDKFMYEINLDEIIYMVKDYKKITVNEAINKVCNRQINYHF